MTQQNQQNSKPSGTNGFALAGFITALVGIPILGLIFGYVALSQIKQTKQDGHGFALAGIIISYVYIGLAVLALIIVMIALGIFTSFLAKPFVEELPNIINAAETPANRLNKTNTTNSTKSTNTTNQTIQTNEPFDLEINLN